MSVIGRHAMEKTADVLERNQSQPMLTRSAANAAVGRSSAMRRMRRRTANANTGRLYCSTNGCTSFLVVDEAATIATCHICGYTRRIH